MKNICLYCKNTFNNIKTLLKPSILIDKSLEIQKDYLKMSFNDYKAMRNVSVLIPEKKWSHIKEDVVTLLLYPHTKAKDMTIEDLFTFIYS